MHANEHYGQKQMLETFTFMLLIGANVFFILIFCTEVSLLVNVLHTPSAPTKKHI